MKLLILCTGNSCRSQMAHGFLQTYSHALKVFSAGTHPAEQVNPLAVQVMAEKQIDISAHTPHHVSKYTDEAWDYVITVCGEANETCPVFLGQVKQRLHLGFEDPSQAQGSQEFIESEFRRVRDLIDHTFYNFYRQELKEQLDMQCTCGANDFCRCN